ncbi:HAD family hydrolase [Bacillus niameyensis]|uniref:HAD family hydrolase n=1 Tax=Bacillus niameyensis TaxID=1522308 RepID=UPI000B1ABBE2|nr:HAD family hydrolase [Bacillus niameyensis]
MTQIKAIIFDWGDTLMRDFPQFKGAMAHWERVEEIPKVKETLEILSGKYVCCVASNAGDSDTELMALALNRVGIKKYFHHLFTSRELKAAKPNPDFFKKVVENLNFKPEECMMVGNDYEKDIVPAKAVGIHTVLFAEEGRDAVFANADYVIHSIDQLHNVI